MSNTDPTKNRVDPRCSRRISSYKDLLFLLVFKAFVLLCSSMSWNKLLCTLFWYNNRIENKTVYRQINDLPLQLTIKIWNYNINNLVHVTDFICYVKWTYFSTADIPMITNCAPLLIPLFVRRRLHKGASDRMTNKSFPDTLISLSAIWIMSLH